MTAFIFSAGLISAWKCFANEWPDIESAVSYHSNIPVKIETTVPLPAGGYHEDLFWDGENIWVNNGRGINTWIVSIPGGEVIGEIVPPGTFTEGIAASATPDRYWVTDWDTRKLYRVELVGKEMRSEFDVSFGPALPTGVARVEDKIYVITWSRGLGTRYHLLQLNKQGFMLRRMRIRGIPEPSQLCWDGRHLWITSWHNRRVYRVDLEGHKITGHFHSPARDTTGIVWDGEHMWVTGTYDDLYKLTLGN